MSTTSINTLIPREEAHVLNSRLSQFSQLMTIPPSLCCPLSKKIFKDPVVDGAGNTFDRESILHHFQQCQKQKIPLSSPLTKEVLNDDRLVPNKIKKGEVEEYKKVTATACYALAQEFLKLKCGEAALMLVEKCQELDPEMKGIQTIKGVAVATFVSPAHKKTIYEQRAALFIEQGSGEKGLALLKEFIPPLVYDLCLVRKMAIKVSPKPPFLGASSEVLGVSDDCRLAVTLTDPHITHDMIELQRGCVSIWDLDNGQPIDHHDTSIVTEGEVEITFFKNIVVILGCLSKKRRWSNQNEEKSLQIINLKGTPVENVPNSYSFTTASVRRVIDPTNLNRNGIGITIQRRNQRGGYQDRYEIENYFVDGEGRHTLVKEKEAFSWQIYQDPATVHNTAHPKILSQIKEKVVKSFENRVVTQDRGPALIVQEFSDVYRSPRTEGDDQNFYITVLKAASLSDDVDAYLTAAVYLMHLFQEKESWGTIDQLVARYGKNSAILKIKIADLINQENGKESVTKKGHLYIVLGLLQTSLMDKISFYKKARELIPEDHVVRTALEYTRNMRNELFRQLITSSEVDSKPQSYEALVEAVDSQRAKINQLEQQLSELSRRFKSLDTDI